MGGLEDNMTKKVLITGISGFAGSHLAEYLISQNGYQIAGTYLTEESLRNVERIKKKIHLVKIDLTREESTFNLVRDTKPDLVFHLAALTSPGDSFKTPSETITNNIAQEINLLSAIRKNKLLPAKILIISSADIYGLVKKENLPIGEETALMPVSPYAVSKIAQDFLGLQFFLSYKLKIVRVRPFNHIGPRQSQHFVVAAIAKKIAEIEKGKREPILTVGNISSKRDFTDVRDMVRAYVLAIEKGKEGEVYNLGSGKAYKISDILDKLISLASVKIKVKIDKSLLRPLDIQKLLCDATKFKNLTGWKSTIPIEITLKDTLDFWRKMVEADIEMEKNK